MKNILLSFVFIIISLSGNGQTVYPFPQPGTMQGIIYITWGTQYNKSFKYIGDTIMGSYTYNKFRMPFVPSKPPKPYTFCTRYDNGKVYQTPWTPGVECTESEELKYDFNMELGDTFYNPGLKGNVVVDSISTIILLNGQQRKYMKLTGIDSGIFGYYGRESHWIDGIGDIEYGFFYYESVSTDGGFDALICHRDSSGLLYIGQKNNYYNLDCDSLLGIATGINEREKISSFTIHPNPTTGRFQLTMAGGSVSRTQLFIYNVLGEIIYHSLLTTHNSQIDISNYFKGIYFIKIINGDDLFVAKIIYQ